MLFAKRDMSGQDVKTLSQRFTMRFGRYLGNQPPNDTSSEEQLIDITECYSLLGESTSGEQLQSPELQQIIHRLITAYEKQTGQWLEPEQIALAAIKYDIHHQANILRHHFPDHHHEHAELHCSTQTSYLRLALLADALNIKQFTLTQSTPTLSKLPTCQRKLNVPLDDISMPEIEASGRELREHCIQSLTKKGISPDALQACWHLRMRYTSSTSSLLMKCMPIDMMRDVFEAQHKQQFGFITSGEAILIDALEIEVKLNSPCQPGMPAENTYVQQLMNQWEANHGQTGESWKRVNENNAISQENLSFLNCPILKKLLVTHIAQPADLAMSNLIVKNFKKAVDETVIHN